MLVGDRQSRPKLSVRGSGDCGRRRCGVRLTLGGLRKPWGSQRPLRPHTAPARSRRLVTSLGRANRRLTDDEFEGQAPPSQLRSCRVDVTTKIIPVDKLWTMHVAPVLTPSSQRPMSVRVDGSWADAMRCLACGAEMHLVDAVQDDTMPVPGYE